MQLHREIIHQQIVNAVIAEATGPIPYECVLTDILSKDKSGETLDDYEVFALANLIWFFSSGRTNVNAQLSGLVDPAADSTSVKASNMVRSLTKEDLAKIIPELQYLIKIGNTVTPANTPVVSMNPDEWISFVLQRQD